MALLPGRRGRHRLERVLASYRPEDHEAARGLERRRSIEGPGALAALGIQVLRVTQKDLDRPQLLTDQLRTVYFARRARGS